MQKDAEKFNYLSNILGHGKMGRQNLSSISRRSFLKQSVVMGTGGQTMIYGISCDNIDGRIRGGLSFTV
jgi:hypothetical protein